MKKFLAVLIAVPLMFTACDEGSDNDVDNNEAALESEFTEDAVSDVQGLPEMLNFRMVLILLLPIQIMLLIPKQDQQSLLLLKRLKSLCRSLLLTKETVNI